MNRWKLSGLSTVTLESAGSWVHSTPVHAGALARTVAQSAAAQKAEMARLIVNLQLLIRREALMDDNRLPAARRAVPCICICKLLGCLLPPAASACCAHRVQLPVCTIHRHQDSSGLFFLRVLQLHYHVRHYSTAFKRFLLVKVYL